MRKRKLRRRIEAVEAQLRQLVQLPATAIPAPVPQISGEGHTRDHNRLPESDWSKAHPYTPGEGIPR
jgi:hypothetical protein